MIARRYKDGDLEPIVAVFTDTVRQVNVQHYSPDQIAAWAPRPPDLAHWRERFASLAIWVAESNGQVIGFCGLGDGGHVDFLYTDYRFQRQRVASRLYQQVEAEVIRQGARRLFTEASITARPFFEKMGFKVLREQQVEFRGVMFQNYVMEKHIALPDTLLT